MNKRNPLSYSIWFMPETEIRNILEDQIDILRNKYGGPKIVPHVTLASGFLGKKGQLINKVNTLSKHLKRGKLFFQGVFYEDEYFRSIYLKIKYDLYLKEMRRTSLKYFDCQENIYLPHMSLAYGDYNVNVKKQMKRYFNFSLDYFFIDRICLAHNNEAKLKWLLE